MTLQLIAPKAGAPCRRSSRPISINVSAGEPILLKRCIFPDL
jgi:hypothetical protein